MMTVETEALMTADELLQQPDGGFRYELIEGKLKQMWPAAAGHGATAMNLSIPLGYHIKQKGLGQVFAAETGFLVAEDPDTVLAPDMAFVRAERLPGVNMKRGYFPGPPDLALEVISPSDTLYEVDEKVEKYLQAGTLQVWVANPSRTVEVHDASGSRVLNENDELDAGDLVPEFSLRVSEIFP